MIRRVRILHQPPRQDAPTILVALIMALILFALPGPDLAFALQVKGLQSPQSFVADSAGDQYFISNINGDPEVKDNNGFITKLDQNGKVVKQRFIRGGEDGIVLHAPKGMAIVKGILYVADLDAVRGFDTKTGRAIHTISFTRHQGSTEATSLADVAHDGDGILYASDTQDNTIYRIDTRRQHAISVLVRDASLAGPRGLAVHPRSGRLIVVSWDKGKILEVDAKGTITVLVSNSFFSSRFHNLDGVDFDKWGNMYVSDFTAGKVWRMRPDRRFHVIAEYLHTPADIGVDREKHLILVPYLYANTAEMNGLESPVKSKKRKRTLRDYGFRPPRPGSEAQEP